MNRVQQRTWAAFCEAPTEENFGPLYDESSALVYTMCRRILGDEESARDAFQGTYCRLLAVARSTPPGSDPGAASTLVYRLAVREADALRQRQRRRARKEILVGSRRIARDTGPGVDEIVAGRQLRDRVETLVAALPDKYRIPLALHYFDGLTHQEISAALGLSRSAVSGRLARALRKLEPALRRAGMERAGATLGAVLATSGLLSPPVCFAASSVFSRSVEALAASVATPGVSASSTSTAGTSKAAALGAVGAILVGVATWLAFDADSSWLGVAAPDGGGVATNARESGRASPAPPAARVAEEPAVVTADATRGRSGEGTTPDAETAPPPRPGDDAGVIRLETAKTGVFGTVIIEETGQPAAGALVVALPVGKTAIAGEDGSFEIPDVAGQLGVGARLREYVSHLRQQEMEPISLEKDERFGPITLRLARGLTLSGTVRDETTGEAVQGAVASVTMPFINGVEATTDADGRYALEGLPAMQLRVDARAPGFAFARVLYELSTTSKNVCDFDLELEGVADVRVFDTSGKPLDGVRVAFFAGESFLGWRDENITDAEGRLELRGLSVRDPPRLELSKDGYRLAGESPLAFNAGERRTSLSFILRREPGQGKGDDKPYAFAGRVVDEAGRPLEGVSVRWSTERNPNSRHETTRTDAEGNYRLGVSRTDGDRQLCAFGKGWAVQRSPEAMPGPREKPTRIDFTMKAGRRVEAVVVDARGAPVSGVMVCPLLEGKERHEEREIPGQPSRMMPATTDTGGRVGLEGLPDGDVVLTLRRSGFSDIDRLDVEFGAAMRIELQEAGVIKARIVDDATGEAVTEFVARVGGDGVSVSRTSPGQKFATTDGRFELGELNQGRLYRVTIEAPGYPPSAEKQLEARAPDVDREEVIRLVKATRLTGIVTAAESGRALPGASVALATPEHGMYEWSRLTDGPYRRYEHLTLLATDEAGAFEAEEGEDARTLFVRCPGFARRVIRPDERALFMSDARRLTIPLEPASGLTGRVFRRGEPLPDARVDVTRLSRPGTPFTETIESIRTAASGEYRVDDLAAGTYRISVYERRETIGFAWIERTVELARREEKEIPIGHDLGPFVLYGRVLGADGIAVEHARVRAVPEFAWHYGQLVAYTGRDGDYRLDGLRPGAYAVTASKSFHPPRGTYYTLEAREALEITSDAARDFAFQRQYRVATRVELATGASSRRVDFTRAYLERDDDLLGAGGGRQPMRSAHCEIDGDRLEFSGWYEGTYNLSLNGSTAGGGSVRYEVVPPLALDNTTGDQDLEPIEVEAPGDGVLEGTVLDAAGVPERSAVVTLTPAFGWAYRWFRADADEAGRFRIEALRSGRYTARVSPPRSAPEPRHDMQESIEIGGSTTRVFRFPAEHLTTVRFRWPPGVPDERHSHFVRAMLERAGYDGQVPTTPDGVLQSIYTDIAEDRAEFRGRLSGEYLLRLVYDDGKSGVNLGLPAAFRIDNLRGDQDLGAVEIPASELGALRVRVTSAGGELPRHGTVYLFPDGDRDRRTVMGAGLENGELHVPAVPGGTYEVAVAAFGCRCEPPASGVTIAPGETGEVHFELVPQGAIKGTARSRYEPDRPVTIDRVSLRGPGGVERVLRRRPGVTSGMRYTRELAGEDGLFGSAFVFARLDAGTYELTVEAEGFDVDRRTLEVEIASDRHLWLRLRPSVE